MLALALLLAAAATAAEPTPAADPLHEGRVYEGLQRPKAGACKRG